MKYGFEDQIAAIQKAVNSVKIDIPQIPDSVSRIAEATSSMLSKIDLSPVIKQYTIAAEKIGAYFKSTNFDFVIDYIDRTLKPLEEQLRQLGKVHQNFETLLTWGSFGWGIIDSLPKEETYYIKASSYYESDLIIEKCITDEIISELIAEIREYLGENLAFDEAMASFGSGSYRACIMILYSLIDYIFLTTQKIPDKGRRKLAGEQVKKILESKNLEEVPISLYAKLFVPFSAIKLLFANGHDFINEPELPNRNFISHGMNKRPVNKIDCVKVMSILENLLETQKYIEFDELLIGDGNGI